LHLGGWRREVRKLDRARVAACCELVAGALVPRERFGERPAAREAGIHCLGEQLDVAKCVADAEQAIVIVWPSFVGAAMSILPGRGYSSARSTSTSLQ
jgi:hypothetical protein